MRPRSRPTPDDRARLPRVVVVAQGPPVKGGISSFATTLVDDPVLRERFDLQLLNTTRKAERQGGALTPGHAAIAITDSIRVFRAGRRADIVHLQTALMPVGPLLRVVALGAAGRLARTRVLIHVHSGRVNAGRAEAFTPSPTERRLLRLLRVAHKILTVSDAGAAVLRPLVPGAPIERFDNAVDSSRFTPRDDDDRRHDAPAPPVLVYVGTLMRRKGMLDLIAALDRLRGRGVDDWRFEIIGGGHESGDDEANELRRAVVAARLDDGLLGSLDHAQIAEHLAAADVFVLPSHWEGQPIAVLEAMAAGLPIVGTVVGAMPDVVREGVDGLLVEPHDVDALTEALARLLGDAGLRRKMGANARRRIEDGYDLDSFRERVTALYDEQLAAAPHRAR